MPRRKVTEADLAEAAQRALKAQADLEKLMLRARAAGWSLAQIGDATGYSAPGVMKMVRRHEADR
jgi:hypothetical protein